MDSEEPVDIMSTEWTQVYLLFMREHKVGKFLQDLTHVGIASAPDAFLHGASIDLVPLGSRHSWLVVN